MTRLHDRFRRLRDRIRSRVRDDDGNATVEFVFVAVIVMVPLVYLVVAVAVAQRSSLAVTQAAREAGRAMVTADTVGQGQARAEVAVRLALADQGLPTDGTTVTTVATSTSCDGPSIAPTFAPGSEFTVCVARQVDLPGVPSILAGRGVTTVGRFVVHVDDFRAVAR
ncbi:TadE/TadG family type IV pilus assembly protein [Jatrophihabitans sp. YIM 134969]